jgi:hypothetical protein
MDYSGPTRFKEIPMPSTDEKILKELENISFLMGDLNAIRNGDYDAPRGADPSSNKNPRATLDDLYSVLQSVVGQMEKLNENMVLVREAVYGQTSDESGDEYEEPKHGAWGVVAGSSSQAESYLRDIDKNIGEIRRSGSLK